jgi:hypothetical protein
MDIIFLTVYKSQGLILPVISNYSPWRESFKYSPDYAQMFIRLTIFENMDKGRFDISVQKGLINFQPKLNLLGNF